MVLGLKETWLDDPYAAEPSSDAKRIWISTSFGPPLQIGPLLPIHRENGIALLQLLSAQLALQPEPSWKFGKYTYVSFHDWQRVPGWEQFSAEVPTEGRPQCLRLEPLPLFNEASDGEQGPLLLTPMPTENEREAAAREDHFDGFACHFDLWLFRLCGVLGLRATRPWDHRVYGARLETIRIAAQTALPDLRRRFLLGELDALSVRFSYFRADGNSEAVWLDVSDWSEPATVSGLSQHTIDDDGAPQQGQPWSTETYLISDYSLGKGATFTGAAADELGREFGLFG